MTGKIASQLRTLEGVPLDAGDVAKTGVNEESNPMIPQDGIGNSEARHTSNRSFLYVRHSRPQLRFGWF